MSWCGSSAAAWQLSFGTPQHTRVAGLLAKADRLRLRTARSPCRAPRQWPAASSHGARPGACPCRRLPLFQPPVLAPQPPTGHVERPTKRKHTRFSRSGVVRWALAGASSTPPAGDRADRPILGLAWRRASNQATTQASVHCICTAQATTHGRKTRPVAGEWCLGCVAAAAVPRRSVPSCPAVQLSHCPDSCLVRGPGPPGARACARCSGPARC